MIELLKLGELLELVARTLFSKKEVQIRFGEGYNSQVCFYLPNSNYANSWMRFDNGMIFHDFKSYQEYAEASKLLTFFSKENKKKVRYLTANIGLVTVSSFVSRERIESIQALQNFLREEKLDHFKQFRDFCLVNFD